jgi:hypothetical protein
LQEGAKNLSSIMILTPYNYFEWKPKVILLLQSKGLYGITMETKEDVRDLTPHVGRIIYSDVIKVNINKA